LDIVELLVINGVDTDQIAEGAAKSDNIGILRYCLDNNFYINTMVYYTAVYHRSYNILKILLSLNNNYHVDGTILSVAAENNDHVIFDMLLENCISIDPDALSYLCSKNENIPFIQKLLTKVKLINHNYDNINEYFSFEEALVFAVEKECADIVDYLFSLNFPVNEELIAHAAKKGNIPMIKKLITHNIKISTCNTVNIAVLGGHLNTVIYLIEVVKAPYSNSTLSKAAKGGQYEICKYLLTLKLIPKNKVISSVVLNNKIKIFELLIENNKVRIEVEVINFIVKHGRYDLLILLFNNKNVINKSEIWKKVNEDFKLTWESLCEWKWNQNEIKNALDKYIFYK
jgi:hypothetical protein